MEDGRRPLPSAAHSLSFFGPSISFYLNPLISVSTAISATHLLPVSSILPLSLYLPVALSLPAFRLHGCCEEVLSGETPSRLTSDPQQEVARLACNCHQCRACGGCRASVCVCLFSIWAVRWLSGPTLTATKSERVRCILGCNGALWA